MKNGRWKKLAAALLAGMMAVSMAMTASAVNLQETEWDISKSKTATNLDENFESKVTLSLPSAEEQLVTDVVFVLDKSTSADLEQQALIMLENLKEQVEGTGAKVQVGVVIFNKVANVEAELTDLATGYETIEGAITSEYKSGTNTHAGLLVGKKMLDEDTAVEASRKYLIFVSDGLTYMYNEEPTATAWSYRVDPTPQHPDGVSNWVGVDNWNSKYGSDKYVPTSWSEWMTTIGKQVEDQGTQYEYSYDEFPDGGPVEKSPQVDEEYANSIDKALYLTAQTYLDCVAEGYHCYAIPAETKFNEIYPWGPSFMEYLAGGEEYSFADIQNDIYYLLDAGSKVVDTMGKTDDYDFDFVNDLSKITLTVDGKEQAKVKVSENVYGFGGYSENLDLYDYLLEYDPKADAFTLSINVPVEITKPVQLTYSVKLANPKTEAGVYGKYDADGSQGYEGLYTNNSAILYPVATDGLQGAAEEFPMPTVSYEVKAPDPGPAPEPGPAAGDNGSALPFVLVMAAAGLGAVVAVFGLRRRERSSK